MTYDPNPDASKPPEPQEHGPVVSKLSHAVAALLERQQTDAAAAASADAPTTLSTPPLTEQEKECVSHAAQEALFTGLAPTDAEIRLGDQYQALQQQDDLTQAVLAQNELNPYRSRAHSNEELSAKQAADMIAQERHMSHYLKNMLREAMIQHRRAQRQRQAVIQQFLASINEQAQAAASAAPYYQEANSESAKNMTDAAYDPAAADEEPQGGLGPNFDRAQRAGLLRTAPEARRASPVFAYLSPHGAQPRPAAPTATAAPASAPQAAPRAFECPMRPSAEPTANARPVSTASTLGTPAQEATPFKTASSPVAYDGAACTAATSPAPAPDAAAKTPTSSSLEPSSAPITSTAPEHSATPPLKTAGPAPEVAAKTAPASSLETTSGSVAYEGATRTAASPSAQAPEAAAKTAPSTALETAAAPVAGPESTASRSVATNSGSASEAATKMAPDLGATASTAAKDGTDGDTTGAQSGAAALPHNFAQQALHFETCRKLVTPLLTAIWACEDEILGRRYEHLRESSYSFYQLEEVIFGTGFDNEERRTHSMLEFLIVLASQNQEQPFTAEQADNYGRYAFLKRRNRILRQILFNNQELGIIAATTQQDAAKWQQWFELFCTKIQTASAKGRKGSTEGEPITPYNLEFLGALLQQLQSMCHGEFDRFVTLVKVLRSWSIDTDKNRQWSTMFLFPFGYDALFWEIETNTNVNINLMGGSGQNIFSMLARAQGSSQTPDVGQQLVKRFFADSNGLNLAAGLIGGGLVAHMDPRFAQELEVAEPNLLQHLQQQRTFAERVDNKNIRLKLFISATRYLPYRELPRFNLLREDFETLSRLDLTKQELFLALGSLGSLHQICYLLEQECKVLTLPYGGAELKPRDRNMVVVVNPEIKTDGMRALSMRRLKENSALFTQARSHYVQAHLRALVQECAPTLLTASTLSEEEQVLACNLMRCAFDFRPSVHINLQERTITATNNKGTDSHLENITLSPNGISYAEIEEMLCTHERDMHMKGLHQNWGADIGLITREKSVTYFYSISDELLYYLVLALVPKGQPMALKDFLQKLHQRYYLVIGPHEAQSAHYALEDRVFIDNERQFKLKLSRNHLLISLSDACDYVRNPFS